MDLKKTSNSLKTKHHRLLFGFYSFVIIMLAVLPINSMSKTQINDIYLIEIRLDYLLHSVVFIPFAMLYFKAVKPIALNNIWFLAGAGILLATFTEGIQYFLSYRSYNINDLLANYLGVLLGMGALLVKSLVSEK